MTNDIKLPDLKVEPVAGLPSVIPEPKEPEIINEPEPVSEDKKPKPVLFELRLAETKTATGSIPITWCIDREWLLEHNNTKYYVLLCSAPPNERGINAEWRGYAKLSDLAAYITFYRPGPNRILACLGDKSDVEIWMDRNRYNNSGWGLDAINFYSDFLLDSRWARHLNSYIDLDLPKECFAKEPSVTEKKWVNFFFRQKAVDQCEFRRRRILAYTVQPIAFLVFAVLYIACIAFIQITSLMIGKWCVWEDLGTMGAEIKTKKEFLKVKKIGNFDMGAFNWVFVPTPIIITLSIVAISFTHNMAWLIVLPLILLWLPLVFGICLIGERFLKKPAKKVFYQDISKLEPLLCSSSKKIVSIKDIPIYKRPIKLQFQGIKSKVCKPFSR